MQTVLIIVLAYLLGSVSFAILVSRVLALPDPRGYGSGNPGATNVLRSGSKLAAALTLFGAQPPTLQQILDEPERTSDLIMGDLFGARLIDVREAKPDREEP